MASSGRRGGGTVVGALTPSLRTIQNGSNNSRPNELIPEISTGSVYLGHYPITANTGAEVTAADGELSLATLQRRWGYLALAVSLAAAESIMCNTEAGDSIWTALLKTPADRQLINVRRATHRTTE